MRRIICFCLAITSFFCFSYADTSTLELKCEAAYLIEASTGEVLFSKNEHEKLRPASVTKVMTLLLIMEALDNGSITLEDRVPCSENAKNMGGSQIWLDTREQLSVNEMLKAIAVVSANDCSVAMAEFIAGSEGSFVDMMNKRANELGMNDTVFKNCHGIDEDGHITSAHDIAVMSRELIKHEKIFEYTTIWMDSLRDGKSELVNTNKLLKTYTGANGLKTGSTSLAKYNLSATAKRNDMQLIGVVMKAPTTKDRFNDAKMLLDYGFANYSIEKLTDKGEIVGTYEVQRGIQDTVNGITQNEVTKLFKKGTNKNIETEIVVNDIIAPMQAGEKIGEVIYKQEDKEIARCNIVLESSIDKKTFGKVLSDIMNKWVRLGR